MGMNKYKPNVVARVVYGLVALSGAVTTVWLVTTEASMAWWSWPVLIVGTVGMLNWGLVAATNNRTYDLFGLLGL